MIDQFQYLGLIQTDHGVIADDKSGNPTNAPAGHFLLGCGININVLLNKLNVILFEKSLCRFTMGTGLGGKQDYIFHYFHLISFYNYLL